MSVILLADDSPHARRMGERILSEEGYRVVCLAGGEETVRQLAAVDPDVIIADAYLPELSGIELCRYVQANHRHAGLILTLGQSEDLDEAAARRAGCNAILRKPFEASLLIETLRPLVAAANGARRSGAARTPTTMDHDDLRAAIQSAVERELPRIIEELTQKVMLALRH